MPARPLLTRRLLSQRTDLELSATPASRFLPAVIAVMVFLAVLALAGGLGLGRALSGWNQTLKGHLTAEITASAGVTPSPQKVRQALILLSGTEGVLKARALSRDEVEALLRPWLGQAALSADLPIPTLIEVDLVPGAHISTAALAERLASAVPGARLDQDASWLKPLMRLTEALRLLAGAIILLVALATILMVVLATRTGLAVHREVIAVLHLIGAHDLYIARQFQSHILRLSLLGALPGLVAALCVMGLLHDISGQIAAALLPSFALDIAGIGALVLVPLAASALAMLTARWTVLGTLRRMI